MVNIKLGIHKRNLKKRLEGLKNWNISTEDKKDLLKFLNDLGMGKINKGKNISESRQLKYLDILKTPLEFFNKPLSQLTLKDMENFEKGINSNKIKSYKKKPFALSTKADINRALKTYLKWKLGDNGKFRKLTDWIDTRMTQTTPDYLNEEEVNKLFKACKTDEERYFIAVLFDSGARAEEFHNIRYEDIQLPKNNESYVKIALKKEYSKTQGRVISLYWKNSLESVRDYLKQREKEGIKSNEPVFNNTYDAMRQFLYRIGQKVLKKSIHYHLFRHTSSTYYASKMNRQQLCYRYGWRFSSDMPDVYISRAGMESKELDEKFSSTELEDLKIELEKEKRQREIENDILKKEFMKLKELYKQLVLNLEREVVLITKETKEQNKNI